MAADILPKKYHVAAVALPKPVTVEAEHKFIRDEMRMKTLGEILDFEPLE